MSIDGVVLVHGGYHGAWCWDRLRPLLEVPSVAVDLPGRGSRLRPEQRVHIADCVDAVLEDADAAGMQRFVLVGHSMGGLTLTGTGLRAPERIAHAVYVAALVPPPGQTVFELMMPDREVDIDPIGVQALLPSEVAREMFAKDLTDEDWDECHGRCVPEPSGLFIEPVPEPNHAVPATYIACTRDVAVPKQLVDAMLPVLQPVATHEIDSDHDVMLSHAAELAELLNRIIADVSSPVA
jgi:pimeloyl-ACP methyl ester carboxylesterase